MVRLVFRPYTQIRRTICTSVSLRASTRVSSGFTLFRHSSPSFGSQQICSYSNPPEGESVDGAPEGSHRLLSFRIRVCHPTTRICVRLLGPCYETGRWKPLCQHPRAQVRIPCRGSRLASIPRNPPPGDHQGRGQPKRRCTPQSGRQISRESRQSDLNPLMCCSPN